MTQSITYDELVANRPQIFTVDEHQAYADNGVVLVTALPALDMVPLKPGQQLNYTYAQGEGVTAYSVGPDEAKPKPKAEPQADPNEWPKKGGGGWYELSNGEKVRGEDEATEAQAALDDAADEAE